MQASLAVYLQCLSDWQQAHDTSLKTSNERSNQSIAGQESQPDGHSDQSKLLAKTAKEMGTAIRALLAVPKE
jgi:hypothetical protein